jgi:hypothetical protein
VAEEEVVEEVVADKLEEVEEVVPEPVRVTRKYEAAPAPVTKQVEIPPEPEAPIHSEVPEPEVPEITTEQHVSDQTEVPVQHEVVEQVAEPVPEVSEPLPDKSPGVNFINILQALFLHESNMFNFFVFAE